MEWWQIVLLAGVVVLVVLACAAFLLWRKATARTKALGKRVSELPWRQRVSLVWRLTRDERVPLAVRAIPPLLILYLMMPVDIVPDFIPVIGQLDDILVLVVAMGLLLRFVPLDVIDSHLDALELEARTVDRER
jgi:uncharacterized membrane protein YkvA (DUF1232 family)